MQRMGDLILSYPLMLWLERTYPGHPIHVAAEENFFKPLMKLSPAAYYYPWGGVNVLKQQSYEMVINLSIQEKAARLAYEVKAEHKIGPVQDDAGNRFVHGNWQLYRTSLVENNLYNRFHWADLNALDVIPAQLVGETRFDVPRQMAGVNKVGLFLGASEAAKRPTPQFWADLIHRLLGRGLRPVLFGGPAEVELGKEVLRLAQAPALNLCGTLGLDEFGAVGQTLALFITPDTGPMHLSAWTGLRCLNISMGNVNPWETGPYPPGHFALRADMDCAKGCWKCSRSRLYCHDPFDPARIASLAARLVANDDREKLSRMSLPGLNFFETGKRHGLYHIKRLDSSPLDEERYLSRFWQRFFGYRFGLWDETSVRTVWKDVADNASAQAEMLLGHIPAMGRQFKHGLKTGALLDDSFWGDSPEVARPLTGYTQMSLANGDYSRMAWAGTMDLLEALISCCR